MYAKIINKETKQCEVGLGTNTDFYQSIGMAQMDVEQCEWDGCWYLVGYVPEEPEEHKKAKRIAEIKSQLAVLDEKSARSMRAILAETATDADREFLAHLEAQAEELRKELQDLQES